MTAGISAGLLCLPFLGSIAAYALPGWDNSGGEWRYYDSRNALETDAWRMSGDKWYYLSSEGSILKNTALFYKSDIYFLDENGVMATDRWIRLSAENDGSGDFSDGWYYFGSDGKAYRKQSNSKFKKEIEGKEYVFDEDGRMLTGWLDESGNTIDDSEEDPFTRGIYLAGEDGALLTGEWYRYGDKNIPFTGSDAHSGVVDRDYSDYQDMWFYFNENSKKVYSKDEKLEEKKINGVTYGFDENGVMDPWWSAVASVSELNRSNPTSSESAKFYAGYNGGGLMKNQWIWTYPSENLDEKDYEDQESSWWRVNDKGQVLRNRIRTVNGKKYAFDGLGRMKTGFVLFDGGREFVAQYDVDDWSSDDFIYGNLYGIERADLYLFSPDEWNDGSMQSGKNVQVTLDDGQFTFGFRKNGKAYGNRNSLEKVGRRYYINGLLLKADSAHRYGLVQTESASGTEYRVVSVSGTSLSVKNRALDCGDGEYLLMWAGKAVAYVTDLDHAPRWIADGPEGSGFYRYDSEQKNHYSEALWTEGSAVDLSGLPADMNLNFKE